MLRAGPVSFNHFQSLSLGRVGLGDAQTPSVLSILWRREAITHRITSALGYSSEPAESPAPSWQCRQRLGEGAFHDRPGRAVKCHSECKAGREEAGFSLLHVLPAMKKLINTRDKKTPSILRLNRGQGTLPRQQLTTGHTWGQGRHCPSPWANE